MNALKFALRQRFRDWPATLIFALVLGSALSAGIAWYSIARPLLLDPLPYQAASRVIALEATGGTPGVSWGDANDLRSEFQAVATYSPRTWGVQNTRTGPVQVLLSAQVTGEFFEVLGERPAYGVPLSSQNDHPSDQQVVWLTQQTASSRFGDPAQATGKTLWINDKAFRVAGVMPRGFAFPIDGQPVDFFLPAPHADFCCARGGTAARAIAKLRDHTSLAEIDAALEVQSSRLASEFPQTNSGRRFVRRDLRIVLLGSRTAVLRWTLAGCLLLLCIATANGFGVWVAQWQRARRDDAIRLALGATRYQIFREHGLQGAIAGALAGLTSCFGAKLLLALPQSHLPTPDGLPLDAIALGMGFSILAGFFSATLPLLSHSSDSRLQRGHARSRSARVRLALTTAQLALTAVLGWSAIAIAHNVNVLLQKDRGFRTEQILLAGIGIPEARYNTDDRMISFHRQAIQRLKESPGITEAAGGVSLPFSSLRTRFLRDGEDLPRREQPQSRLGIASPGLLRMLGISVVRGRSIEPDDRREGPKVALVNESFVRAFFGGRDPLRQGLRIAFYNGFEMKPYTRFEVVGIVADTRNDNLLLDAQPAILVSSEQIAMEGFFYFVRTSRTPAEVSEDLRRAIWSVDPAIQQVNFRPLQDRLDDGLGQRRMLASFTGLFLTTALVIVCGGLFSSISATLLEMTKDLSIRVALGARPLRIAYESLRWAISACVFGFLFALPVILLTPSVVAFEKTPLTANPANVALSALLLIVIVAAAGLTPAMRACSIDPVKALRQD